MSVIARLKKAIRQKKNETTSTLDLFEEPPSTIDLIEQVLDGKRDHPRFFRPSMLFGCDRQNYFHYTHAPWHPSQLNNRLMKILDNGTAVHGVLQRYIADHPEIWFAPEARIHKVVEGALIRGSCDGIVIRRSDGYRWGIEIKTINHNDFMKLTKPKPEHVLQASLYAVMHKVHWITILYWSKDKNTLREFPVEFDASRWKETKRRIKRLKTYVDAREIPEYDKRTCNLEFCSYVEWCRKKGAPI